MLFYAQLQQMDGKWNDKWAIMVRKWMKYMLISDGQMENSKTQHKCIVFHWSLVDVKYLLLFQ